jgi:hypothetical protein
MGVHSESITLLTRVILGGSLRRGSFIIRLEILLRRYAA